MTSLRLVRAALSAAALAALVALLAVLRDADRAITASLGRLSLGPFGSADVGVRLTPAAALLLVLVTGLGAVVGTYCVRNLAGQYRLGRFAALELGAVAALSLAVTATSLPLLAAGWTLGGLAVGALVAHAGSTTARDASRLVRTRLLAGDALLWIATGLLGWRLGTLDLAALPAAVPSAPAWLVTVSALLVVGAGIVRSALVPAHRWLPETAEAPSPVSALLHAGLVNGVGVLALAVWPLLQAAPVARGALLLAGGSTALLGTAQMRVRPDVKGRLAASTSAQMGYLGVQAALGLPAPVLTHVVGHGLWKASAFLGAGGAVDRVRRGAHPAARPSAARVTVVAAGAVAVVAVGATVPGPWGHVLGRGPAELVPLAVAALAAGAALLAARTPLRALAVVVAVLAYLLGIRTAAALEPSLAPSAAWGEPGALPLTLVVAALSAAGALAWWADRQLAAGRWPSLAARIARTSLPPTRAGDLLAARPAVAAAQPAADAAAVERVRGQATTAADVVGPTFPLAAFVASNPLAGLENLPFRDALAVAARTWGSAPGPDAALLRAALADGRISGADLDRSANALDLLDAGPVHVGGRELPRADVVRALLLADPASEELLAEVARLGVTPPAADPRTPLEALAATGRAGTRLDVRARSVVSALCARVFGDPVWPAPDALWSGLRAEADGLDQALGLRGAGAAVAALPADPAAAVAALLDRLAVPDADRVGLLSRLLAREPGWAAHVAWRARQGVEGGDVLELIAARLAVEVLVAQAHGPRVLGLPAVTWAELQGVTTPAAARPLADACAALDLSPAALDPASLATLQALREDLDDVTLGQVRLRVLEETFRRPLLAALAQRARGLAAEPASALEHPATTVAEGGPDAQLVTCIDVRSERLRRHLEALGPWETLGAAGFFGLALHHVGPAASGGDRCPALLRPTRTVAAVGQAEPEGPAHAVEARPFAPFALAEAAGWITGPLAVLRTVAPRVEPAIGPDSAPLEVFSGTGFPVHEAVDAAEGLLRSAGLLEPAPVVVLAGHGGAAANNPHVAAYDCGACGGWAGDVNARAMAAVLNDERVRAGLAARGLVLPATTRFVAGLHDTTRDVVHLLDADGLSPEQASIVARLREDLGRAGELVAAERAPQLPGAGERTGEALRRHLEARAVDWAQPRPEWGLAGNASMIIGPRALTAGLDLQGRVFLQSYRPDADPDGSVLEGLLAAPLVVGQWINLQYWCSTVDPERFGAGDKTTHNAVAPAEGEPVALTGVLTGTRGDLRIGLPWQGVGATAPRDGRWTEAPLHEPLRLLAVVAAAPQTIEAVLTRRPDVARLVLGEWIALTAVDPGTGRLWRRDADLGWLPLPVVTPVGDTSVPTSAHDDSEPAGRER